MTDNESKLVASRLREYVEKICTVKWLIEKKESWVLNKVSVQNRGLKKNPKSKGSRKEYCDVNRINKK